MANLPVPNPRTFVVGEYETAAYFNAFRDAINFLTNPPMAVLTQATAQTYTNGVAAQITFDTTVADTYTGHSNTTNNSRYTAQVAGWYQVDGTVSWNNISGGDRTVAIWKNGSAVSYYGSGNPAASININPSESASGLVQLNVGDYVEIAAYQNSGGSIATHANGSSMAVFWVHA